MRSLPSVFLLLLLTFAFSVLGVSGCAEPSVADIHATPTSVVQAYFRGFKEDNCTLIFETLAPGTFEVIPTKLQDVDRVRTKRYFLDPWGVTVEQLDPSKIIVKLVRQNGDAPDLDALGEGAILHFDPQYNGRSINENGTLIKLDGKWYIKNF